MKILLQAQRSDRPLIAQLLDLGHEVVALTRSPERARALAGVGSRRSQMYSMRMLSNCCHPRSTRSDD